MFFRGINNITLDAKGRMAMPACYRESLLDSCGGKLITTVDPDHSLLVYPTPAWEQIESQLVELPGLNRQARALQRLLIGYATECELDGQGRILLPPMLREYAGLDKKIVLIGQGRKFEIWDEQTWHESEPEWLSSASAEGQNLAAALEDLKL